MKMKGFKLRKNSTFTYVPRYSEEKSDENLYKFDGKFLKYKNSAPPGIRGEWGEARKASRTRGNREVNKRLLLILGILVVLVLWIFDFDLSIFYSS